jgi:uncharacterized protein YdeI (BOF family)
MDPQKKKVIIAVVLMACMIVVVVHNVRNAGMPPGEDGASTSAEPASPETVADAKSEISPSDMVTVEIDPELILAALDTGSFVYDFTSLRDPMAPVIYAKVGDDETGPDGEVVAVSHSHNLDGIVWDPYTPLASIDDTVVGVGEQLADGAIVQSISQDKVILSTDSGTFSVGFYEE